MDTFLPDTAKQYMKEFEQYRLDKIRFIEEQLDTVHNEGFLKRNLSIIPALTAFLISIFFDYKFFSSLAAPSFLPGFESVSKNTPEFSFTWLTPLFFILFLVLSEWSYRKMITTVKENYVSGEMIKAIDGKFRSLIVITGFSLVLISTSVFLISIKAGPQLFLGFAVPLHMKSFYVLSFALLFKFVFDHQKINFLKITEAVDNFNLVYFNNKAAKNI